MKSVILFLTILLGPIVIFAQDGVFGTWKAIDDADGQATSHIEIFEKDGALYGKVVKILEGPSDVVCDLCEGSKKDQPVIGMEIIWDMKAKGKNWKGGRILDPENGKTYKCRIKLKDDVLEVRGYIGIPTLGRTQKWYRVVGDD